ncbi:hypothetical protein FB451DRAFT_1182290 [Mycena latifolia]|nr:hypothetical protein FB451DRAFT_1182290 [Mycena latifolia]
MHQKTTSSEVNSRSSVPSVPIENSQALGKVVREQKEFGNGLQRRLQGDCNPTGSLRPMKRRPRNISRSRRRRRVVSMQARTWSAKWYSRRLTSARDAAPSRRVVKDARYVWTSYRRGKRWGMRRHEFVSLVKRELINDSQKHRGPWLKVAPGGKALTAPPPFDPNKEPESPSGTKRKLDEIAPQSHSASKWHSGQPCPRR